MLVFHLKDYPEEKQKEILTNILSNIRVVVQLAYEKKDTFLKMSFQIKNTGTDDPTATITGDNAFSTQTILEI